MIDIQIYHYLLHPVKTYVSLNFVLDQCSGTRIKLTFQWLDGRDILCSRRARAPTLVSLESKQIHPFCNLTSGLRMVPVRSSHDESTMPHFSSSSNWQLLLFQAAENKVWDKKKHTVRRPEGVFRLYNLYSMRKKIKSWVPGTNDQMQYIFQYWLICKFRMRDGRQPFSGN